MRYISLTTLESLNSPGLYLPLHRNRFRRTRYPDAFNQVQSGETNTLKPDVDMAYTYAR